MRPREEAQVRPEMPPPMTAMFIVVVAVGGPLGGSRAAGGGSVGGGPMRPEFVEVIAASPPRDISCSCQEYSPLSTRMDALEDRVRAMRPPISKIIPWIRRHLRVLVATAERRRLLLAVLIAGLLFPLTAGESLPAYRNDLCTLFAARPTWHDAVRASSERWQVPIAVQMAIVRRESDFYSKARPPRTKVLGLSIGPRPSTAYGYGQVLDSTWDDFRLRPGHQGARRDRFADVAQFLGWYIHHLHRTTGIDKNDPYNLYLAYHEGPKGYQQARHQNKRWLLRAAQQVAQQSDRYNAQLTACDARLARLRYLRWLVRALLIGSLLAWGWRRWGRGRIPTKIRHR